jgi:hypothetical protein
MSLPPAQSTGSDAALGKEQDSRGKLLRHPFIVWFEAHPALSVACPHRDFVGELTAHPLYCLASRISVQRWELMLRCRFPSRAHAQQWHVNDIVLGLKQRSTLLVRAAFSEVLARRLVGFRGACSGSHLLHHAKYIISRRHFIVSKGLAEDLFRKGQRLYEQQHYSDAAKSWGHAALLQHGASHAFLSDMLIYGRPAVPQDEMRAFELAAAGAAMGCVHSKGALGSCLVLGIGVVQDARKGLALARESAAAGSCFGQNNLGYMLHYVSGISHGIAQDYAEALCLYRLAAAQGLAAAQSNLGYMYHMGQGIAPDRAEAIRWYRLAAAQGFAVAITSLKILGA